MRTNGNKHEHGGATLSKIMEQFTFTLNKYNGKNTATVYNRQQRRNLGIDHYFSCTITSGERVCRILDRDTQQNGAATIAICK